MKKYTVVIIVAAAIVFSGIYGYKRYKNTHNRQNDITVIEIQKEDMSSEVSVTGTLEPRIKITLTSSKKGQVEDIFVNEGDYVKEGQELATVSSEDRNNLLIMAKKNLERARLTGDAGAIAKAEEESEIAEASYQKIPIISPLAGLVTLRNVEPGQKVEAATTILEISDELVVKVLVDETDIGKVKEGMKTKIVADAYPEEEITGKIIKIAYTSTSQSNVTSYEVLIKITSRTDKLLKSGMTADAIILVQEKKDTVKLPVNAVSKMDGKKIVMALDRDSNIPYTKEVEIGIEDDEYVEITSGLDDGDKIVIINKKSSGSKKETGSNNGKKKSSNNPPPMMMGGGPR